ncbi:uncharacterized protein BDZ99DRAFT_438346 [Mytilinidion resinicola]|uniref:DNA replication regulator Sld3 C-terminal domain-containing protein n=1 Tax=Mytilinidion resinicola TaxID=574789 RepID=A0A6A6YWG4_9PEZI|nr:uncharacterized protein BDZ99DRAFT_438346 [Mytilinidion resinicola]KAF2813296.1 hypothetical protein BDZ99DRAFT_438346 [Mytilinidion resinicola]
MSHARPEVPSNASGLSSRRASQSTVETSNKRKRDSTTGVQSVPRPFLIRPYPKSIYDKPTIFTPLHLIPRSQLPLTYLDTSVTTNPSNRLFSSHIDVLEQDHVEAHQEPEAPKILITRNEADKALYAVERIQESVYGLCKLAAWLKEKDVSDAWDSNKNIISSTRREVGNTQSGKEWWHAAAIERHVEPVSEERAPKRLRMSMLRPNPLSLEATQPGPTVNSPIIPEAAQDVTMDAPDIAAEELLSAQQIFENLVAQYLDALYLSKTSLAYFAKGPMSRARAAVTSAEDSSFTIHKFTSFLRSSILSHSAMDRKYREKLSEVVKSIPPGSFSDDENSTTKPRKGKAKKVKLSRDGMYPREDEYVKKWWISDSSSPPRYGEVTLDQRLKKRVGDLRIRETLAQLIFMLEILALEALPTYKEPAVTDEAIDGETQTQQESQAKPKKKRQKKVQDIKLLIDLLLDKLCIWQSVEQDEDVSYQAKGSKSGDALDANSSKSANGDRLRSFCVEVIVPFYMSRLPEQAAAINKRLGGPVAASPAKRKSTKPPTTSRKSGEPNEPEPKKRRTLGRVVTETIKQLAQRTTPSLHRSFTDSALLPGLKREASEVPLSAIPFQRSPSTASNRQALSQFNRLSKREVDLTTKSATALAKISRQKRVEEELKDAISTLKKPQRGLAVGGYVEDAEKRGLGSANRSRKSANPTRKVLQNVQVTATPRRVRKTKDIAQTPFRSGGFDDLPPSSSTSCIPSSAVRPPASVIPGTEIRRTAPGASHGIAETPSRGPGRKSVSFFNTDSQAQKAPPEFRLPVPIFENKSLVDGVIPHTPSKSRMRRMGIETESSEPATILSTPFKPSGTNGLNVSRPEAIVFSTPVRKPTLENAASALDETVPTVEALGGGGGAAGMVADKEKSIYDVLGWDDDDDLL